MFYLSIYLTDGWRDLHFQWNYDVETDGTVRGWNEDYLASIGLSDLAKDNFSKIGSLVVPPGQRVGGLSVEAALGLGLEAGTPVSSSLIDAHAGALGMLAGAGAGDTLGRLGLVSGEAIMVTSELY